MRPAHQRDQTGGDRQPQPGAAVLCASSNRPLARRPEDLLLLVGGDADAGIGDRETQPDLAGRSSRGSTSTRDDDLARSVNLMALPTRLTSTCRSRPGSPTSASGTSGAIVADQLQTLLRRRAGPASRSVSSRTSRTAKAAGSRSQLAGLDLGEIENVVDDRQAGRRPSDLTVCRYSRCSASGRCPGPARSCRGCRSWACGSRGSCWPETRSWPVGGFGRLLGVPKLRLRTA